jgi:hypothetical protein
VAGRCVIKAVIPAFVPESPSKKSSGQKPGAFFMGEWLQKRLNSKATEKALGLVPRAFSIISAGED